MCAARFTPPVISIVSFPDSTPSKLSDPFSPLNGLFLCLYTTHTSARTSCYILTVFFVVKFCLLSEECERVNWCDHKKVAKFHNQSPKEDINQCGGQRKRETLSLSITGFERTSADKKKKLRFFNVVTILESAATV